MVRRTRCGLSYRVFMQIRRLGPLLWSVLYRLSHWKITPHQMLEMVLVLYRPVDSMVGCG